MEMEPTKKKNLAKRHPKKTVASLSIMASIIVGVSMWGSLHKVVCPFFPSNLMDACYQSGQAAAGTTTIKLDEEAIP